MTERAKCGCLECRVRAALFGGAAPADPEAVFELDVNDALGALGNILGELLAHHDGKCAEAFAIALLEHRKRWLTHPRVLAQQDPKGNA